MALAGKGSLCPITHLQAQKGRLGEHVPLCESVVALLSLPHLVSGSDRPEAGGAHLHLTVAGQGRPAVRGCTEPGYACFTEEQASENSPVIFEFNRPESDTKKDRDSGLIPTEEHYPGIFS